MTDRARLAAVAGSGLLPWIVVVSGPDPAVDLVHSFGLVTPSPLHVTPIWTYLLVLTTGLPQSLLAWPVSSLLYVLALASAVSAWVLDREDRRVTGGLLVLGGMSLFPVAAAVGRPAGVTALPVGTAALWAVAWWGYREALVAAVTGGAVRER